jgi:hypothetical protein
MSAYNNTEGGIDEPSHYINEEFTDRPIEKLESQNYDDEKGDPYVKELGNPEGNLRFFIDLTHYAVIDHVNLLYQRHLWLS